MNEKEHAWRGLYPVFADVAHWSQDASVPASWIVSAALGMGVPIVIGTEMGNTGMGMLASLGCFALSGAAGQRTLRQQHIQLFCELVVSTIAVLIGSAAGGQGWMTGTAIVIITVFAALFGGLGKTIARYSSMFIVCAIIGTSLGAVGAHNPTGVSFVFMIGAAWTIIISLIVSCLFKLKSRESTLDLSKVTGQQCANFFRISRSLHWLASLHHRVGWQYALGIGLCMNPIGVSSLVFMIGATWTIIISLIVFCLFQLAGKVHTIALIKVAALQPVLLFTKHRLFHWLDSLYHQAGWLYTLRIGLCMIASETIAVLCNQPRSYWIAIVIAIVVQRRFGTTRSRIIQRGIGTFVGVLAGSIFLLRYSPTWLLVLVICVLAALRPLFKVRNYALYSAVMTPLVVILLEFGEPISLAIMVDRLIETIIGLFIATVLGYLIWPSRHSKLRLSESLPTH